MSKITKKALEKALIELLERQPLSKITVSDITREAGLNRHTFYYHFRNVDDLIAFSVTDLIDSAGKGNINANLFDIVRCFLRCIYDNRVHIFAIMHSASRTSFMRAFNDKMEILIKAFIEYSKPNVLDSDRCFVSRFYLCGTSGLFETWVDSGMEEMPEKVADKIERILSSELIQNKLNAD